MPTELDNKVSRFIANMDKVDVLVHGDEDAVVETDTGPVPSIRKAIADGLDPEIQAAIDAKTDAQQARADALSFRNTAETHKNSAGNSATAAAQSFSQADAARAAAEGFADDAETMAFNAAAQAGTATTQAGIATTKAAQASTSETNALNYRNAAQAHYLAAATARNDAENFASNALSSSGAAANSASNASDAFLNALAQRDFAETAATQAGGYRDTTLTYRNAAEGFKNTAQTAASTATAAAAAAAGSEESVADNAALAVSSANAAGLSETAAAGSAASALTYRNAAEGFKDSASASATSAGSSETAANNHRIDALAAKTAAEAAQSVVAGHASDALASKNLAAAWADADVGVEVVPGKYSAYHWAQQAFSTLSGGLIFRGGWNASTGSYPAPADVDKAGDFYRVTHAGTISGVDFNPGDSIIYQGDGSWFLQDGTDKVGSVQGRTGNVVITKADLSLENVENKSSATIRGELTSGNVTTALGYTPANNDSPVISGPATISSGVYVGGGSVFLGSGQSPTAPAQFHGNANAIYMWHNRYYDGNLRSVGSGYSASWDFNKIDGTWRLSISTASHTAAGQVVSETNAMTVSNDWIGLIRSVMTQNVSAKAQISAPENNTIWMDYHVSGYGRLGAPNNTGDYTEPIRAVNPLQAPRFIGRLDGKADFVDDINTVKMLSSLNASDADPLTTGGISVFYLNSSAANKPPGTDHAVMTLAYSTSWASQYATDWRTNRSYLRTKNDGTWNSWLEFVTNMNFKEQLASYLWWNTSRDFAAGTLIETDIAYPSVSLPDSAWLLEIKGNSYIADEPFDLKFQGYNYDEVLVQRGGTSVGRMPDGLYALSHNGHLCFWMPRQSYWQGYSINVTKVNPINSDHYKTYNRVIAVTDEAKPSSAYEVNLLSNIRTKLTLAADGTAIDISNTSLDAITKTGFYFGEALTNAPDSGWFHVQHEQAAGNRAVQTVTTYGNTAELGVEWKRFKAGTWSDWQISPGSRQTLAGAGAGDGDWDWKTTPGVYKVVGTSWGADHSPGLTYPSLTTYGLLEVVASGNVTTQRYFVHNGVGGEIAHRTKFNSADWTPWFLVGVSGGRAVVAFHATALSPWGSPGKSVEITGAGTITNFAAAPLEGQKVVLHPAAGTVITHGGSISVQGNTTYTTEAGDILNLESLTTTTFRVSIVKANGKSVVEAPFASDPFNFDIVHGAISITSVSGSGINGWHGGKVVTEDADREVHLLSINPGLYAVVYNKTTRQFGSPTLIRSASSLNDIALGRISANTYIAFSAPSSGTAWRAVVFTLSGDSISTVGSELTITGNSTYVDDGTLSDFVIVGNAIMIAMSENYSYRILSLEISGTTLTQKSYVSMDGYGVKPYLYYDTATSKLVLVGVDGSSGIYAKTYSVAGDGTLTVVGTQTSSSGSTLATSPAWLPVFRFANSGRCGGFCQNPGNARLRGWVMDVSGASPAFSTVDLTPWSVTENTNYCYKVIGDQAIVVNAYAVAVLTDSGGTAVANTTPLRFSNASYYAGSSTTELYVATNSNGQFACVGISGNEPVINRSFTYGYAMGVLFGGLSKFSVTGLTIPRAGIQGSQWYTLGAIDAYTNHPLVLGFNGTKVVAVPAPLVYYGSGSFYRGADKNVVCGINVTSAGYLSRVSIVRVEAP